MEIEVPRRWVILKVRRDERGNHWLSFSDQAGASFSPTRLHRAGGQSWQALTFFDGRAVFVPPRFRERLRRLAALPPRRRYEQRFEQPRPTLPVFVDAGALTFERARDVAAAALGSFLAPDQFELARLQAVSHSRAPFRMPLDVLAVGAEPLVAPVNRAEWAGLVKRSKGLDLTEVKQASPLEVLRALRAAPRDMLVAPAPLLREMTRDLAELPLSQQPRLVVTLDDDEKVALPRLVPSAATLRTGARARREGPLLEELLLGIAHDLPLHEVTPQLRRASDGYAELLADPQTNHGLRMSDAYSGMLEEAYALTIRAPARHQALVANSLSRLAALPPDFQRETKGMVPIAEREGDLEQMRQTLVAANGGGPGKPEPRSVDLRLKRVEPTPLADGPSRVSGPALLWAGRNVVLAADTRYVLEVQVGTRHPATLLAKPAPPIDELLDPKAQEHELDVVLFALDFHAGARTLEKMKLKREGTGPVVSFAVKTPREASKRARLRVCVYWGNHLVQSFLLTAVVEAVERFGDDGCLDVSTEFSRSERLSDFEAFKPRELALALNDDGAGTHTLMFKGGAESGTVPFAAAVIDAQVKRVRDLLREQTDADNGLRFDVSSTPTQDQFDEAVYDLAKAGKGITRALYTNAPKLRTLLREATQSSGKTVQVLRLVNTYAFPWTVLYDYELPAAPEPICLGEVNGAPCGHGFGSKKYCVNGFWGVRHCIEEHLALGEVEPAVPLPRSPLLLALGVRDGATAALVKGLKAITPAFEEHDATKPLLDEIWPDAKRPSHLVVLGHLHVADVQTGDLRIQSASGPDLLSTNGIADRLIEGPEWSSPRPLVFLMACASAASSASTLNDLLISVASCNASAVVGTECDSYSSLVGHFAESVTRELWNGATLGVAMRSFRRSMLARRNPLGFAFTAVGDSEVQFAKGV